MKRETGTAFCDSCKQEVHYHLEDWGIGAYEYWGARGTHHDWVRVCDECRNNGLYNILENDSEPEWEPDFNEDNWRENR